MRQTLFTVLLLLALGCSAPVAVVKDPFNQQTIYNLTVDIKKDQSFIRRSGDINLDSLTLAAEKEAGVVKNMRIIWELSSKSDFKFVDNLVEISINGKIVPLESKELGKDKETNINTQKSSVGYGSASGTSTSTGGIAFSSGTGLAVSNGSESSIITNKTVRTIETLLPNNFGALIQKCNNSDEIYIKIKAVTNVGNTSNIWQGQPGTNAQLGPRNYISDFYKKLDSKK